MMCLAMYELLWSTALLLSHLKLVLCDQTTYEAIKNRRWVDHVHAAKPAPLRWFANAAAFFRGRNGGGGGGAYAPVTPRVQRQGCNHDHGGGNCRGNGGGHDGSHAGCDGPPDGGGLNGARFV
ncbi:unnamed protein product [Phaeothamnion confervicola]